MAERHQERADDDGAAVSEHAVREKAAEYRREIDETGVKPIDVRREGLNAKRTERGFQNVLERCEPDNLASRFRLQQVFDEVEHEQRPHAIIGEALPHLGREQEAKAAGRAEKLGGGAGGGGGGGGGNGGFGHLGSRLSYL